MKDETCENCAVVIGKLETPKIWDDHVVCDVCFEKLSKPRIEQKSENKAKDITSPVAAQEVVLLTVKPDYSGTLILGIILLIFLVGILLIIAALHEGSAQLIVTNRKIRIKKPGMSSRTIDIPLQKITAVEVVKTAGQLGSITIVGSGMASVTFKGIKDPENVRDTIAAATEAISQR